MSARSFDVLERLDRLADSVGRFVTERQKLSPLPWRRLPVCPPPSSHATSRVAECVDGSSHPRPLEWSTTRTARSEERPRSGRGERVMLTSAVPGRHRGVLQRCAFGWSSQPKSGSRRALGRAGSWSDRRPRQHMYPPPPASAASLAKLGDPLWLPVTLDRLADEPPADEPAAARKAHETELGSAAEFLSCGRQVPAGP
jgi:hypothetical protein